MPKYLVANTTARTIALRTAQGLRRLAPGASGPSDGFDLAPSHARYYENAGAKVTPLEAEGDGGAGKPDLDNPTLADLNAEDTGKLAEAEKIDLGDLDLSTDDGLARAKAIIAEFRRIWASGNADKVKADALAAGIDLGEASAKYEIVNLMVAHNGVTV